jgi:hypothetical protein
LDPEASGRDRLDDALRPEESLAEFDRAAPLYGEPDPLWSSLGESARTVWTLVGIGQMARRQGADERAEALYEEAKALAEAIGFSQGVALALRALADVDLARGDHRRAMARSAECLALARASGDAPTTVDCLAHLAGLAPARDGSERAAPRRGIAEAMAVAAPTKPAVGTPVLGAGGVNHDPCVRGPRVLRLVADGRSAGASPVAVPTNPRARSGSPTSGRLPAGL